LRFAGLSASSTRRIANPPQVKQPAPQRPTLRFPQSGSAP
jgi:hypothetical protein